MTLSEHLTAANAIMDAIAATKGCEERLRMIAAECGLLLRFCCLPWCGKPYVPLRRDHQFCSVSHKTEYHNKYKRN